MRIDKWTLSTRPEGLDLLAYGRLYPKVVRPILKFEKIQQDLISVQIQRSGDCRYRRPNV